MESRQNKRLRKLVIVDGQQRLTSLYAVVRGVNVVRANYESEPIRIAFNPLEERFEVADAATLRDKAFIPDISRVWSSDTDIFAVASQYLDGLQAAREISEEERKQIQKAIIKLQSLLTFPLTALELAADICVLGSGQSRTGAFLPRCSEAIQGHRFTVQSIH